MCNFQNEVFSVKMKEEDSETRHLEGGAII